MRRFRGSAASDPIAAGRALGVAQFLSGSVVRARDRLRVNVELTSVATGNTMWGRSYDRPADDLLAMQAEIAESVAVNVAGRLAPGELRRIEQRPTRNPRAYDHLLRGRFAASRRTTASFLAALREFEAATRLDSMLTPALVGAAAVYGQLATLYDTADISLSRDSLTARSRALLDRAVRQDSMSAEVLLARAADPVVGDAFVSLGMRAKAVALEPRNADAHHSYALALRLMGEDSAAVAHFLRAVELEPDRAISLESLGQLHLVGRRFPEAVRWLDSTVVFRPDAAFYYLEQAFGRLLVGDTAGARAASVLVASHGSTVGREEILALLEARAGDSVAARARLTAVEAVLASADCIVSHECLELSFTLASVGAHERALQVFERIRPRGPWLAYWSARPEFDSIRSHPRFRRVVEESRAELARLRAQR